MKKNLNYLFWLLAITILPVTLFSCSDDDDEIEPTTLSLSAQSVTFTNAGGEQSLTVTTNSETWLAFSAQEGSWITLTQSGDQLRVNAAQNTEGKDRAGVIVVSAGDKGVKITVQQSAGSTYLNLSADKAEFFKAGGEARIDVVSNGSIAVTPGADWLTVDYLEGTSYFTLKAAANETTEARTGKVTVTAGDAVKEVTVTQEGEDLIVLPFIGKPANAAAFLRYEQERGSVVLTYEAGLASWGIPYAWYLSPSDSRYWRIIYEADDDDASNYSTAAVGSQDPEVIAFFQNEANQSKIDEFMTSKGFAKTDAGYRHQEYPYLITFSVSESLVQVTSVYSASQPQAYPTFSAIPMNEQVDWLASIDLNIHATRTADEITAWELAQGSVVDETINDPTSLLWFNIANDAESAVARAYWLTTAEDNAPEFLGEPNAARCLYSDINKVFWIDGSRSYMTEEFQALLKSSGYTYLGANSSGYQFYSKPIPSVSGAVYYLIFNLVQFSDFMDGTQLIDFQVAKMPADDTSSLSLMKFDPDKRKELVKKLDSMVRTGLTK